MKSLVTALVISAAVPPAPGPRVTRSDFGRTADGKPVDLFTLTNAHGLEARVITYGGILISLKVPDRQGRVPHQDGSRIQAGSRVGRVPQLDGRLEGAPRLGKLPAGLRWDTSDSGGDGPSWADYSSSWEQSQSFTAVHPAGF